MGQRRRVWLEVPGDVDPPAPRRAGPAVSRAVRAAQALALPTNVLLALAFGFWFDENLTSFVFLLFALPLSAVVLVLTTVVVAREERVSFGAWAWIVPATAPSLILLGTLVGSVIR